MKRILSMLMAASLVFTICCNFLSTEVQASVLDSGTCGTNVTWELTSDGTLTISGSGDMYSYSSSSKQPWPYSDKSSIKSIVIEEGITSIGSSNFAYLVNVTSVSIPSTVTSIGEYAFQGAEGLTSITIPASVTAIGGHGFQGAIGLTKIVFEGNAPTFGNDSVFHNVTADVYYPANDTTWTDTVKSSCGGTLTWIADGAEIPEDTPSEGETDEVVKEDSVNVTGTYVPDTTNATVYSVDISWSSMSFTYHDEQEPVWDAENHQYSEHVDAYWEGAGTITITNHSNTEINATPSYAAATGYESADMTFSTAKLTVASAESGSAQTDTIVVTPTGSLPVETNGQVIGIITITLG